MIAKLKISLLVLGHMLSSQQQESHSLVSREEGSTSASQLIATLNVADYPTVSEDWEVQGQASHL